MTTDPNEIPAVSPAVEPAPAVAASAAPISPGAMIREARQAQRLSVDDLAGHTKLARTTVEALERDDFGALVEPVYVRGYYRKCAKVLGVDEKTLIEAYSSRVTQRSPLPPAKLRLASGSDLGSNTRLPMTMGVLFVIIAVVVCGFLWWVRGATTGTAPQSLPTAPAPTAAEMPAAPADAGAAPATSTESSEMPPVPASADAATAPAPASDAAATPAPAAAVAAVASGPLKLSFTQKAWVRITDASGKSLLSGTIAEGTVQQLDGTPPFDLLLGNAAGVAIDYNGTPVDVKAYTRETGTAHFQLPATP